MKRPFSKASEKSGLGRNKISNIETLQRLHKNNRGGNYSDISWDTPRRLFCINPIFDMGEPYETYDFEYAGNQANGNDSGSSDITMVDNEMYMYT